MRWWPPSNGRGSSTSCCLLEDDDTRDADASDADTWPTPSARAIESTMRSAQASLPRATSPGSDLGALRREAEALAKERGERASTTHVLVALATREGVASDLLTDRRVT